MHLQDLQSSIRSRHGCWRIDDRTEHHLLADHHHRRETHIIHRQCNSGASFKYGKQHSITCRWVADVLGLCRQPIVRLYEYAFDDWGWGASHTTIGMIVKEHSRIHAKMHLWAPSDLLVCDLPCCNCLLIPPEMVRFSAWPVRFIPLASMNHGLLIQACSARIELNDSHLRSPYNASVYHLFR